MHDDEVDIDDDLVRGLLAAERPELLDLPLTRLDTWGTDHVIYRLGDELALRLPKIGWAADNGETQSRWLPRVASLLPVEVPVPVHVGRPCGAYPYRWYLAPWLVGDPVSAETTDLPSLARDLAAFVLSLGAIDPTGGPTPGPGKRGGPLAQADAGTRKRAEELREDTDVDALLAAWQAGIDTPPWAGPPRWVHADLMDGNLLLGNGRLSGVIDWGSLTTGDPAVELMIAWSLFDGDARGRYREALGFVDDDMWLRGRAWATSTAVQALPYYRDTNPDIVARSWRAVEAVIADVRSLA